jgi:glycosyltransferase involved in cell wall biosynthesis
MPDLPTISVVTPSFNQAAFLETTLQSVLSQNYPGLEYLVFDGGSTDGSVAIIQRYAQQLSYWQSAPDKGQTDAINQGWSRATGDVIAWINSDDYYLPQALFKVGEEFQKNPDAMVVIGSCLTMDAQGRISGDKYARSFSLPRLLSTSGWVPGQPAVFVKRQLLQQVGFPDVNLHYVMDWEYWIRLALFLKSDQIQVIYKPLAVSRMWPGNKTLTGVKAICDEHRLVLERLFASGSLPAHLQELQASSFAGTYLKQSFLEWQAGRSGEARASLAKARQIFPAGMTNWQAFGLWCRSWVPFTTYYWLRKRWIRYWLQPFRTERV